MGLRLEWQGRPAGPVGERGWQCVEDLVDAVLVTRSRTTVTERGRLRIDGEEQPVYRKRWLHPRFSDALKGAFRTTFLAPSRARRERDALLAQRDLGVPLLAPRPVVLAERRVAGVLREALLAVAAVPGGRDLTALDGDAALAEACGRVAGRLHAAGWERLDLAPRNLVATRDGADWQVWKIDSGRQRAGTVGGPVQAHDLATLLAGLEERWEPPLLARLRATYATVVGAEPAGVEALLPETRAARRRRDPRD